jgi:glutamate synthase (NADPH/NADH) large chain
VLNGLRGRIVVQADGQLKTGRDVVIAALLGAEEFGFATAPLVVLGCIMMRVCHLDTCPVGVATQDPELRGTVHRQARARGELLRLHRRGGARVSWPQLGFRTARRGDRPGRAARHHARPSSTGRHSGLDLSPHPARAEPALRPDAASMPWRSRTTGWTSALDLSSSSAAGPALERARAASRHRCTVAQRQPHGGHDARLPRSPRHGGAGPARRHHRPSRFIRARRARASAPSCRGASPCDLEGDANDYVGKGLSGGRIVVRPARYGNLRCRGEHHRRQRRRCYGATSGEVYLGGPTGERFCVRNSGATAVVEGVGDHGCEYMTGGTRGRPRPDRTQLRGRHVGRCRLRP